MGNDGFHLSRIRLVQRTAAHISRLTVMEPQFIYQKQRWASFVHRGSSWAVCEMHSALQHGLAGERLISIKGCSLVLHEQTVHQFTRTTSPKTHLRQPLMIFFIMPPLGGGAGHRITNGCDTSGKHFPDTDNSVTSYQDFAADVPVFDCFSWLTLPTQVNAAQWRWWGRESGSALRYCTLTPYERVLIQCAKYRGVSNETPWKRQCKIKGSLICFQKNYIHRYSIVSNGH